jgi:bud emergence protein 1
VPAAAAGGAAAAAAGANANASNTGTNAGFIKIKIFHRATDDLVAIRVPPSVTYAALLEKVRDRLGNDINVLRYREQMDAGGSAMMRLSDDDDLKDWLGSGAQKLTLYADSK